MRPPSLPRPLRGAALAALLLAGCGELLGFPDVQLSSTGGSGGGTICAPGTTSPCYSGSPGSDGVGICHGGVRVCRLDGSGFDEACIGEVVSAIEDCAAPDDEDCDGKTNEADPDCACEPGSVAACYEGPPATLGIGLCAAGTRTCNAQGTGHGACTGQVPPAFEKCDTPAVDEDCDGILTCSGAHRWSLAFGDAALQHPTSVAVDADGNVYVTGFMQGTVDFGGGPRTSAGGDDIFLVKLDPQGKHLWSKVFGDAQSQHGYDVAVDGAGDVILVGDALGDVDFGGGVQTGQGGYDAFVAKFGPSGNLVFGKLFGDAGSQTAKAVAVDGENSIVLTGQFGSVLDLGCGVMASTGNFDLFAAKISAIGGCAWSKHFGDGLNQMGLGVATDPTTNDAVITGTFAGTLDFGGGMSFTEPSGANLFIAELGSADGIPKWAHAYGDAMGGQQGHGVAIDTAGNVYVTGYFTSALDLAGGLPGASAGAADAFLAKLDSSGNTVYGKKFGDGADQFGERVAVDAAGNVILAVSASGAINFGNGALPFASASDAAVAKLDPMGNPIWSRALGGLGDQTIVGVAVDARGSVVAILSSTGSLDAGGGPLETAGGEDVVVVKLAP